MLYNKEQVMKFLPHRDPFLFIDTIKSIHGVDRELIDGEILISMKEMVGLKVIANFFASENLDIFRGHFPGNPVLPGVVQVEMMAQASCFAITKLHADPLSINLNVALMGVNNAKFRKPVLPNMNLELHSICTKARGSIVTYDCQLYNNEVLMSQSSILASVNVT